jgi:hypothetical protein
MHRPGRNALTTMAMVATTAGFLAGCGGPVINPPPPPPPVPTNLTRDCLTYNTSTLKIVDRGDQGWGLTDGYQAMEILDTQQDAEQALALARQGNKQCFIGRDNQRPNRRTYIVEAYNVTSPPLDPLPQAEDCIPYNTGALRLVDLGASGWRLTDGVASMLMLDNQTDAGEALTLARKYSRQCFIGRDNARADRLAYIVQYWK